MVQTLQQKTIDKVFSHISKDEHVKLLRSLVDIPSPPGAEIDVATFIEGWFKNNGIPSSMQLAAPNRPNVVGVLRGTGGGRTLIYNGHTDVGLSDAAEKAKIGGNALPKEYLTSSYLEDGKVCGWGAVNDKGPVSSFMIAAKALAESGVSVRGDVYFTAVVGEIERSPVGEYQGPQYLGGGLGTRHLVGSGIRADYAVVAEPSDFAVTWTIAGHMYLRISTFGMAVYFPNMEERLRKDPVKKGIGGPNAIENMLEAIKALKSWGKAYAAKTRYKSAGGNVVPMVNIGSIEAGLPYKPNYSPARCSIYVDCRIPPFVEPLEVMKDLENYLRMHAPRVEVDAYRSFKGYEAKNIEPLVKVVKDSYRQITGSANPRNSVGLSTRWNDNNPFNEVGIPALKCGPGPAADPKMPIKDLTTAARLYSLVALKVCS